MKSFAEFEAVFLGALQQERSELQGLSGASEAQLSAWIEHLFRDYLGYTHFKEITREGSSPIGSKGSKQLFPDLRINVLDHGVIFVECKRLGRLDGPKGLEELACAKNQLMSYIRAHLDQSQTKPKTVLGLTTDGNRWHLMGLDKTNQFHTVAEWNFLTDDPRLIAQRTWLMAKPALAQPTSALVEFLARLTLAEVLQDNVKWLTRKVNEKLPDGSISEDLLGRWLRDAFADATVPSHLGQAQTPTPSEVTADIAAQETPDAVAHLDAKQPPEVTDRDYWKSRATEATLLLADDLFALVKQVEGRAALKYNKFYIGLEIDGSPRNFVTFRPRKSRVSMTLKLPRENDIEKDLQEVGFGDVAYDQQWKQYTIKIDSAANEAQRHLLLRLIRQASSSFGRGA